MKFILNSVRQKAWRIVFVTLLMIFHFPNNQVAAQNTSVPSDTTRLYDLSLDELMKIKVITATRGIAEEYKKAPGCIFILTRQQIEERGYTSVYQFLSDLPDIKTDHMNNTGNFNNVNIRGISGNERFLILLDGKRITAATDQAVPIIDNYPLNMAERVEVIIGPASALYGADAFAGVVNIISRDSKNTEKLNLNLKGGTYNKYAGNFWMGRQFLNGISFTIGGQASYDQQADLTRFYKELYQGYEPNPTVFNTTSGPLTPREPVDNRFAVPLYAGAINAKVSYKKWRLLGFTNVARTPSTIANNDVNNTVVGRSAFLQQGVTMVNLQRTDYFGRFSSYSDITFNQYKLSPNSNYQNVFTGMNPGYVFSLSRMFKVEEILAFQVSEKVSLSGGVTFENFYSIPDQGDYYYPVSNNQQKQAVWMNTIYPNNPGGVLVDIKRVRYNNAGGFLQLILKPVKQLSITLGGRYDANSKWGNSVNPRCGVVYAPSERLVIKSSVGTAFLSPQPGDAYSTFGAIISNDTGKTFVAKGMIHLPNPNIKPQRLRNLDLSVMIFPAKSINISVTGYICKATYLVQKILDVNNGRIYSGGYDFLGIHYTDDKIEISGNLGAQVSYGGNILVNYKKRFNQNFLLDMYGSFSYTDGWIDLDDNGPMQKRNLPGVAPYSIKAGVVAKCRKITFSPRVIYFETQRAYNASAVKLDRPNEYFEIKGYTLLNAMLKYTVNSRVSFYVQGENLLDQRYRNISSATAPKKALTGSAQAGFRDGAPQNPIRIFGGVNVVF